MSSAGSAERGGDVAIAVGLALAADCGVEPAGEQRRQVAGVAVAEEQLLRRHRAGGIHVQRHGPRRASAAAPAAASG